MGGRPQNQDRQNALDLGLKTYEGAIHKKCGTTTRYAKGGGCVQCARDIADAQRAALKQVQAERSRKLDDKIEEQIVNHVDNYAVDNVTEVEVDPEADAEARAAAALEELM